MLTQMLAMDQQAQLTIPLSGSPTAFTQFSFHPTGGKEEHKEACRSKTSPATALFLSPLHLTIYHEQTRWMTWSGTWMRKYQPNPHHYIQRDPTTHSCSLSSSIGGNTDQWWCILLTVGCYLFCCQTCEKIWTKFCVSKCHPHCQPLKLLYKPPPRRIGDMAMKAFACSSSLLEKIQKLLVAEGQAFSFLTRQPIQRGSM